MYFCTQDLTQKIKNNVLIIYIMYDENSESYIEKQFSKDKYTKTINDIIMYIDY